MAKIDELEIELEDLKKQFYYFVKTTDLQQMLKNMQEMQTTLVSMQSSVQLLSSKMTDASTTLLPEVEAEIENKE